jgi:predicted phage terminase large subunit-like protein
VVAHDRTPGRLARWLDRTQVQTPALTLIDQELVDIRDAITVMLRRRERFAELLGIDNDLELDALDSDGEVNEEQQAAVVQAQIEIPDAGNNLLCLSMPPQEGKSSRVGRYGMLWLLRQFPALRLGIVSYDGDHAARISYMLRADIQAFDGTGGNPDLGLRLKKDQRAVSRWTLETGDDVYAIGIGGGLTGRPLDVLLIDDPVKDIKNADSVLLSEQQWEWWQTVARPRLAPGGVVIVVATRWHEADLIGRLLTKQKEDEAAGVEHYDRWRVLNIPAQADHHPELGETDPLGREPGEFMISARGRTKEQWEATKAATGSRFWTALYQGRPAPDTGEVWLNHWWRRYDTPLWAHGEDGTYRFDRSYKVLLSWDMAFKDKASSDYVVGQVWAHKGSQAFLVYQVRKRLSFTQTLEAFKRMARLFPDATSKLVEDKANGTAVIDSLKTAIPGITPVEPLGGKKARAEAVAPFIEAGNVLLPTAAVAAMQPDISFDPDELIVEATAFPNGAHDDQVDATSQALAKLYLRPSGPATIHVPRNGSRRMRQRKPGQPT